MAKSKPKASKNLSPSDESAPGYASAFLDVSSSMVDALQVLSDNLDDKKGSKELSINVELLKMKRLSR